MRRIFHRKAERHEPKKPLGRSRIVAAALAATLAFSSIAPVYADALAESTPKQEVVYIKLNSNGSVQEISVVNIFDLNEAGEIIDYGDYTALRNMTTNDEIVFENETVRIDTNAGKLYYEGILSKNTIPWGVAIQYYLNGVEYAAEQLAGKSGALKITVAIRKNPDCSSAFFDNYGLQAFFTLDTALCKNIVAEGATAANVGADRQLTYTILPSSEKDITITADVTDFEMDGISVNGLPLNMDVTVDTENNKDFNEAITDIEDAVAELDDGAGDLLDGAEELRDGAKALKEGANDAQNGTRRLYGGLKTLDGKSADLTNGAYAVFVQLAQQAEAQLNAGLTAIGMPPVALTPENYASVIDTLLAALSGGDDPQAEPLAGENEAQPDADVPDASRADAVYQDIHALKEQLDEYGVFYSGLCAYTAGVGSSADGARSLCSGIADLSDGAIALYDGAVTLCDGVVELKSGTLDFRAKTADLDTDLKDKINDAIHDTLGGDFEVISFVSDKNTNVEAVQFVITTDGIGDAQETATDAIAAEPLTFWEKLLSLFGLYKKE